MTAVFVVTSQVRPDESPSRLTGILSETGLYSDINSKTVATNNISYSPQYPLWSDGATKKRWIYLPPGTSIDATDPDNWIFPVGTKFWKEFSFGKRVETRLLEKVDSSRWAYATYAWNEDGSDATLVSAAGSRNCVEISPGIRHDIPGVNDCKACHEGAGRDVVLGFNALQLSPDRDSLAPHAEPITPDMANLQTLIAQGRLTHLPDRIARKSPRILADSPRARAALGYLWANCGGCHNAADPLASVGMYLKLPLDSESAPDHSGLQSAIGKPSKFQIPGLAPGETCRIKPGEPENSSLVYRMHTRNPFQQMPPLGTKIVDEQALDLIINWIRNDMGSQPTVQK